MKIQFMNQFTKGFELDHTNRMKTCFEFVIYELINPMFELNHIKN